MLAHSGDFWNRNWLRVQLTIFWEVAVGALRFRRDFLISCRAGSDQPTRPEPPSPHCSAQSEFRAPVEGSFALQCGALSRPLPTDSALANRVVSVAAKGVSIFQRLANGWSSAL